MNTDHPKIDDVFDRLESRLKIAEPFLVRQLPIAGVLFVILAGFRFYSADLWLGLVDVLLAVTSFVFWKWHDKSKT